MVFIGLGFSALGAETNELTRTERPDPLPGTNDPVELEYRKLLEQDDRSQAEVDRMIKENRLFAAQGGGLPNAEMNRRIMTQFDPVMKGYQDFIRRHPGHVRARIAYGSFLGDINDEEGSQTQLEKALEMETNNPAVYNNLANIYGHTGSVKKAFEFYTKAIELNPKEPVYLQNFATTVYLFRKDVMEAYGINEQQVFDKALGLYSNALRLNPTNFPLATDLAQTFYGIRPPRIEPALTAWTNAMAVANDEIEREGVHIHFARLKMADRRFDEARGHLESVKDPMYKEIRAKLERNLAERIEALSTNAAALTNAAPTGTNSNLLPSPP
jgi:tetratricopeptide (TPR) repeat protein